MVDKRYSVEIVRQRQLDVSRLAGDALAVGGSQLTCAQLLLVQWRLEAGEQCRQPAILLQLTLQRVLTPW